jgi:hypothetical protein
MVFDLFLSQKTVLFGANSGSIRGDLFLQAFVTVLL